MTLLPFSFRNLQGDLVDVTEEHIDEARRLIDEGWYQTSRRHRRVARLPPGKTVVEALLEAARTLLLEYPDPHFEDRATGLEETDAKDLYLSCYALRPHRRDLDEATFAAFRKLGGQTCRASRDRVVSLNIDLGIR